MKNNTTFNRRKFVLATSSLAAALFPLSPKALAATEHHHSAKNAELVKTAAHCVHTGNTCIAHCLDMFSKGKTEMAECARSVQYLVSMCDAVGVHAASDSKYLKSMLVTCQEICIDCEAECRKFEEHVQCKDCADSCVAMYKISQTYLDAA